MYLTIIGSSQSHQNYLFRRWSIVHPLFQWWWWIFSTTLKYLFGWRKKCFYFLFIYIIVGWWMWEKTAIIILMVSDKPRGKMYVDTVLWILFSIIHLSSHFPFQLDLNTSPTASLQKVYNCTGCFKTPFNWLNLVLNNKEVGNTL